MATVLVGTGFRNSKYLIRINCLKDLSQLVKNCAVSVQPNYLCFNNAFDENEKNKIIEDMRVYENFITETEESSLLEEVEPYLKRMRYERNHWDNAITNYRETERRSWNSSNSEVINKVRKFAFPENAVPLKQTHVLDLQENGVIMPHIDSVKFCGTTIAGISLLSDSVMRLVHDKDKRKIVDILLRRYSLYIMTGCARYDYTHEILGNEKSKFNEQVIKKAPKMLAFCPQVGTMCQGLKEKD